jgi:hypothetical protein
MSCQNCSLNYRPWRWQLQGLPKPLKTINIRAVYLQKRKPYTDHGLRSHGTDPKNRGSMFPRNIYKLLSNSTASYLTIQHSSYLPLRQYQIQKYIYILIYVTNIQHVAGQLKCVCGRKSWASRHTFLQRSHLKNIMDRVKLFSAGPT